MTLEEAMRVSNSLLLGEREDALTNWRRTMPQPEPERPQKLDTAPAQQVDWALIIRQALLGERAFLTEDVGVLAEAERMIAQAAEQLRTEFAEQLNQLRAELSGRIDLAHTQGSELKAQLEAMIARKKRAKTARANGGDTSGRPSLLLPAPANGNGRAQ